jgi:hypothetical protein
VALRRRGGGDQPVSVRPDLCDSAGWFARHPARLTALIWAVPLSLPATWAAAVWVRHLIREAEAAPETFNFAEGRTG